MFSINPHNTRNRTKIAADYILSFKDENGHSLFFVKADKHEDVFRGISCFRRSLSEKNFTDGHIKLHIIKKEKLNLDTGQLITLVQTFKKTTVSESTPNVMKIQFDSPKMNGLPLSDVLAMPANRGMDMSDFANGIRELIRNLKDKNMLPVAQSEPLTHENSYYQIVSDAEFSSLQKEKGLYHEARRSPDGEIIVRCHKQDKEKLQQTIAANSRQLSH